jgi:hypothetical protein
MPAMQTILADLNHAFGKHRIEEMAKHRERFAPGRPLGTGLVVQKGTPLYDAWQQYLHELPGSFHETLRSVVYYALSTSPPTHVTFAWAPGYDYELTLWQAPDTRQTRGGITVLVKSRYPGDKHPVPRGGSRRARRAR